MLVRARASERRIASNCVVTPHSDRLANTDPADG
jgi:hypothetical protein